MYSVRHVVVRMAAQPSKYNNAHQFQVPKSGVRGVVRYDRSQRLVTRFAVQLQVIVDAFSDSWETIAQIDHEPGYPKGHNLYMEGVHVDIYHRDGTTSKLHPQDNGLATSQQRLMYDCAEYLADHVDWFLKAANNQTSGNSPPSF